MGRETRSIMTLMHFIVVLLTLAGVVAALFSDYPLVSGAFVGVGFIVYLTARQRVPELKIEHRKFRNQIVNWSLFTLVYTGVLILLYLNTDALL